MRIAVHPIGGYMDNPFASSSSKEARDGSSIEYLIKEMKYLSCAKGSEIRNNQLSSNATISTASPSSSSSLLCHGTEMQWDEYDSSLVKTNTDHRVNKGSDGVTKQEKDQDRNSSELEQAKQKALEALRGNLIKILEERLRKIFIRHNQNEQNATVKESPSNSGWDEAKLVKVAKALDNKLYQAAPTLECYCDLQTLDKRIREQLPGFIREQQTIMERTQRRPPCQKRPRSSAQYRNILIVANQNKKEREKALRDILKSPKYELTKKLIHEINLIKLRTVARPCRSGKCVAASSSCDNTAAPLACFRLELDEDTGARESLPGPVSELFFNTPLVNVFEKVPISRLQQQNWNALLAQAARNYKAYKDYAKENKMTT